MVIPLGLFVSRGMNPFGLTRFLVGIDKLLVISATQVDFCKFVVHGCVCFCASSNRFVDSHVCTHVAFNNVAVKSIAQSHGPLSSIYVCCVFLLVCQFVLSLRMGWLVS